MGSRCFQTVLSTVSKTKAGICPSAPFLVPSRCVYLLNCLVVRGRIHATTQSLHTTCQLSKSRSHKHEASLSRAREKAVKEVERQVLRLSRFRELLKYGEVQEAMQLHSKLVNAGILESSDCRDLVGALLQSVESVKRQQAGLTSAHLLRYAGKIVQDLKDRKIEGSPEVTLRLLSFFKNLHAVSEGQAFWQWAERQDESHVNVRVYASAIEMLDVFGVPLQRLESLFTTALTRFPGNFIGYHLSPGAILPDRSQPVSFSGASPLLLKAICLPRLEHFQWKEAYMALDTALRLYPNQMIGNFLPLWILNRPLGEAYRVFLLACRSLAPVKPPVLGVLLNHLLNLAEARSLTSPEDARNAVLAMLYACHIHTAVDGALSQRHLARLIKGILLLGRPYASSVPLSESRQPEVQEFYDALLGTSLELIDHFASLGYPADASTYDVMVTQGRILRWPELSDFAFHSLQELGLTASRVTHESMIRLCNGQSDFERMEVHWEAIVSAAQEEPGHQVSMHSWRLLAQAGKRCDVVEYFDEQLELHGQALSTSEKQELDELMHYQSSTDKEIVQDQLDQPTLSPDGRSSALQPEKLRSIATSLAVKVQEFREQKTILYDYEAVTNVDIHWPFKPTISHDTFSEEESIKLYDQLTTDPAAISHGGIDGKASEQTVETGTGELSSNGDALQTKSVNAEPDVYSSATPVDAVTSSDTKIFPYAKARYQNWNAINQLLILAQHNASRASKSGAGKDSEEETKYGDRTKMSELEDMDWQISSDEKPVKETILELRGVNLEKGTQRTVVDLSSK